VLDLDSKEERGGTSLSNSGEAQLAVHLYLALRDMSEGVVGSSRVAVITPYAQQASLLRRCFGDALGPNQYERFVEVNTVDAFQGREASIVIFSAVRADGSKGIGFLSDVRRMNVALTRAKHFLFVICRCESVVVNPYWRDLVNHARETDAVIRVPYHKQWHNTRQHPPGATGSSVFGDPNEWQLERVIGTSRVATATNSFAEEDASQRAQSSNHSRTPASLVHQKPASKQALDPRKQEAPLDSRTAASNKLTPSNSQAINGEQQVQFSRTPASLVHQKPASKQALDPRKAASKQEAPLDPRTAASNKLTPSNSRQAINGGQQAPADPRKLATSNKESMQRAPADPRKRKRLL
jgi:hypothetical protein